MKKTMSIWDEFKRMQEQMDMMFENFFVREPFFERSANLLSAPRRNQSLANSNYKNALTDIYEKDNELIAKIELPGVNKDDIDVNISDDAIEIKVEKNDELENNDENYYSYERCYSGFYRYIPLPNGIDSDKIKAKYDNGILELKMPKSKEIKNNKKLQIE